MALSPAVAQAMWLRPVFQQGIPGVDEKGKPFLCVPDTRGKAIFWKVPLNEAPREEYMTEQLEQDLACRAKIEYTKDLQFKQINENEWQWQWKWVSVPVEPLVGEAYDMDLHEEYQKDLERLFPDAQTRSEKIKSLKLVQLEAEKWVWRSQESVAQAEKADDAKESDARAEDVVPHIIVEEAGEQGNMGEANNNSRTWTEVMSKLIRTVTNTIFG